MGAIAEKLDKEILKSTSEPIIITLVAMLMKQFLGNLLKFYYQNHAHTRARAHTHTHRYIYIYNVINNRII